MKTIFNIYEDLRTIQKESFSTVEEAFAWICQNTENENQFNYNRQACITLTTGQYGTLLWRKPMTSDKWMLILSTNKNVEDVTKWIEAPEIDIKGFAKQYTKFIKKYGK